MKPVPNLIIFRYPDDEDGDPVFAECQIMEGKLVEDTLKGFTVPPGDSYRDLHTDQIVFAIKDGDGSTFITSFSIRNDELQIPETMWKMAPSDINKMLPTLLEECSL